MSDLWDDDTPENDPEGKLLQAFAETAEFEAWQDFGDAAAEKAYGDAETVEVPTAWLRDVLPEIRRDPFIFEAMRKAWNKLCDEQGVPDLKKPVPIDDDSATDLH